MKYWRLFSLVLLFLGWCSLVSPYNKTTVSDTLTGSTPTQKNFFLWWNFRSLSTISGIRHQLIISWNTFIIPEVFSLRVPKWLSTWEYEETEYTTNTISFGHFVSINDNNNKKIIIRVDWPFSSQISWSQKETCTNIYLDEFISHSKQTKTIHDKILYLDYITFASPNTDIQPLEYQETRCCFVYGDMVYSITLWGYVQLYMNSIIDSLHFY